VSTDEVYGALGKIGEFVETMPVLPNSPYSALKASADMIVRAYYETLGCLLILLDTAITMAHINFLKN